MEKVMKMNKTKINKGLKLDWFDKSKNNVNEELIIKLYKFAKKHKSFCDIYNASDPLCKHHIILNNN
jgi:hypothetical protein